MKLKSKREELILFWRERIFVVIFTSICLLAVAPYVASIIRVISDGIWINFAIYTFTYILCFFILLFRKLPLAARTVLGLLCFYLLGVSSLLLTGPVGSGRSWLFFLSITACLLLGVRTGIITLIINGAIFVTIGVLLSRGYLIWFSEPLAQAWVVIGITFIFLNSVSTIALGYLVKALEDKLEEEREIIGNLEKTHRRLFESQNMLIQALNASSTGAYIIDAEHRVTHWNRTCALISGRKDEEVIGTGDHWCLFHHEKSDMLADFILLGKEKESLRGSIRKSPLVEGGYEGEILCKQPGDREHWYLRMAAPIRDGDGTISGAIETVMDINELKFMESQLVKAQKMESVGRLAGGVAHDYNNISSIVIGYAELVLREMGEENPHREYLEEILSAAERSADITGQLLAFARQQPARPVAVIINPLIDSMLKMLKRLIGENIDLEWLPGKDIWPVYIDPTQIDQIMANLCVNARDAIPDVGRIIIETENVTIDEDYRNDEAEFLAGEYVMLAFRDNGTGIEKDNLSNIFEPFYTTKEVGKGTGLGLATVYGIVRQNRGFINVYSEPGKGTTFKIYLRKSSADSLSPKIKDDQSLSEKQEGTVLVVEDNDAILKLTKKILEDGGYRVITGMSPQEALHLCEKGDESIDLLLTDVIMPEMNGKELAERMKNFFPDLKILYMSGYTPNVILKQGILEKEIEFISKPFSRTELLGKVGEILKILS